MGLARDYQNGTKYRRGDLPGTPADQEAVAAYKHYPDDLPRIELPHPDKLPSASFWETVARRRSQRQYAPADISRDNLFLLLWASQGITRPGHVPFRASPSAGALFPIETYVAANRVAGLAPGLYHWQLPEERLVQLYKDPEMGAKVAAACLDQVMCEQAACSFLWTAVFGRTFQKYGDRGLRYVYLDAGHVGHSLQLAATALGLGSCNIGALFDSEVNDLLGIDGQSESIVYGASVGPVN